MRKNLYAFTPPGVDPPYVSINREDNGRVTLHIRGVRPAQASMVLRQQMMNQLMLAHRYGVATAPQATFEFTAEEYEKFKREIASGG